MAIDFNRVPGYVKKEIMPPKSVIKSGSRGMNVRRVQEWLQYHKFSTAIDGDFGPATAACVRDFQSANDLRGTGSVNKDTWNALVDPMQKSLQQPRIKSKDSAVSTILSIAKQHLVQKPIEIGGPNRGPWVRLYCGGNDGPEWAWCAGFVTLIMQQGYFYRSEKVPLAGSVSCDILATQAKSAGLFVSGRKISNGTVSWDEFGGSCLFLLRRTDTDWIHTGFATTADVTGKGVVFKTIEGNTNNNGSREGFEATARTRALQGGNYDFIRLSAD